MDAWLQGFYWLVQRKQLIIGWGNLWHPALTAGPRLSVCSQAMVSGLSLRPPVISLFPGSLLLFSGHFMAVSSHEFPAAGVESPPEGGGPRERTFPQEETPGPKDRAETTDQIQTARGLLSRHRYLWATKSLGRTCAPRLRFWGLI